MTWSDHFYDEQLDAVEAATGIRPSISELAGNAEGYTRVREVGGQLDMISGDALWVPKYHEDGLVDAWDINELEVAKTLYPIAREFPWWTAPEGLPRLSRSAGRPSRSTTTPRTCTPAPDSLGGAPRPEVRAAASWSRTSPRRSLRTWASTPAPSTPTT